MSTQSFNVRVSAVTNGKSTVEHFDTDLDPVAVDHNVASSLVQAAVERTRTQLGWAFEADSGEIFISWRKNNPRD